jgi:hypothetical protein
VSASLKWTYSNDSAIWESENRKIPHEREVNSHESQVCGAKCSHKWQVKKQLMVASSQKSHLKFGAHEEMEQISACHFDKFSVWSLLEILWESEITPTIVFPVWYSNLAPTITWMFLQNFFSWHFLGNLLCFSSYRHHSTILQPNNFIRDWKNRLI